MHIQSTPETATASAAAGDAETTKIPYEGFTAAARMTDLRCMREGRSDLLATSRLAASMVRSAQPLRDSLVWYSNHKLT